MATNSEPAAKTVPTSTNIVIVGGGVIGISTAFFLAERTDFDILVLERNRIASGSTGDSVGVIRHHYGPNSQYAQMTWRSHEFLRSFEEHTDEPIAYEQHPLVYFAAEDSDDAEYALAGYDTLSALDIPVSKYDSADFEERYPMLDLEQYDLAVSDNTAAFSDATDVTNGFARAASRNGVRIETDVSVTDITTKNDAISGVNTDHGQIAADTVLVTAGPWTPKLLRTVDVEIPLTTSREQVVVLHPPDSYTTKFPELLPMTTLPDGVWTVRPEFGGEILAATHHVGEEVNPNNYNRKVDQQRLLQLYDHLERMIPDLMDAGVQGQYCGVYSNTPDGDFIIDQVGPEGCFVACGFSGHGFKHAPIVGEIMTDLVSTGDTDLVDIGSFALSRFDDNP